MQPLENVEKQTPTRHTYKLRYFGDAQRLFSSNYHSELLRWHIKNFYDVLGIIWKFYMESSAFLLWAENIMEDEK